MANTPISFYNYLNVNSIEIPILQRDYAQGRVGKEALRKTFLTSLKKALDDAISGDGDYKPLQLDFVYGTALHKTPETTTIQPLDGQQRLTTLWLMHWYIAMRAGKLGEAEEVLRKFSYETRISSRTFCEKMCSAGRFDAFLTKISEYEEAAAAAPEDKQPARPRVADFIETSTWFYSKWKQDPTIQSMLRMMSGDKEKAAKNGKKRQDKNDLKIDIVNDAIEKLFADTTKEEFTKYWASLTSDHSPIVFYHHPLDKFGLSDDLYVKMNARGKALTPFENFKADLVGYIRAQREKEEAKEKQSQTNDLPWKRILDPKEGVPILLDTDWMNLFWGHRSAENQIDEAFLTFLNRFFWNELIVSTDGVPEKNASYIHLNKDNGAAFDDFSPYLYDNGEIPATFFEDLMTVLNRFGKFNKEIAIPNQEEAFNYRPIYIEKEKDGKKAPVVKEITQHNRIYFFAITKYFKDGEYDEVSFKRWIRVVSNLISGVDEDKKPQIRNIELVKTAIDKISALDSHKIYEYLAKQAINEDECLSAFDLRFNEEIEKARQILDDNQSGLRKYAGQFETWEEAIKNYETFSFFNGSIRFLYRDENGKANWDDFDQKSKNAELFFSKDSGYYLTPINADDETKSNVYLLKLLYSRADADGFWGAMWWKYHVFSNNDNSWLHLLNHPKMAHAVHHLMMNGTKATYAKPATDDFAEKTLYLLSQTRLLDYVAANIPNPWIRDYHNHKAIYPSSTGIFLNAAFRDSFLQNTSGVSLVENCQVEDTGLLFGSNIKFTYNGYHFVWYYTDKIYLTDSDFAYIIRDENGQDDMAKYFVFEAKGITDESQILNNLDQLITEYQERQGQQS